MPECPELLAQGSLRGGHPISPQPHFGAGITTPAGVGLVAEGKERTKLVLVIPECLPRLRKERKNTWVTGVGFLAMDLLAPSLRLVPFKHLGP